MKMYKTSGWRKNIVEVDVIRKTDKSVWIMQGSREVREALSSRYDCYFDTWIEAHNHLVGKVKSLLDNAKNNLETAIKVHTEVCLLKDKQ